MSSSVIILLLLSLSIHACNARHLRVAQKDSIKAVEMVELDKPSTPANPANPMSEELRLQSTEPVSGKDEVNESVAGAVTEKEKDSKTPEKDMDGRRRIASGAVSIESLVTVSWRPREKHGEHPGFNLDYSPPKTHPPSHN